MKWHNDGHLVEWTLLPTKAVTKLVFIHIANFQTMDGHMYIPKKTIFPDGSENTQITIIGMG